MTGHWSDEFNQFAWIFSNFLLAYIAIVLIVFTISYVILFDPKATTAGRFIFRFALSLVGIIGLSFIGVFIDPSPGRAVLQFPGDVLWWRPAIRLVGYGYVAFTVTGLCVLLYNRKWHPNRLRTILDREIVKTRQEENTQMKGKIDGNTSTKTSS